MYDKDTLFNSWIGMLNNLKILIKYTNEPIRKSLRKKILTHSFRCGRSDLFSPTKWAHQSYRRDPTDLSANVSVRRDRCATVC